MALDDNLIPYQPPFPQEAFDEIVIVITNVLETDEREWVPQVESMVSYLIH